MCLKDCFASLKTSLIYLAVEISYLAYADDIILLSRSKTVLIENFKILANELNKKGLEINLAKCQYFVINDPLGSPPLDCGNDRIFHALDSVIYLGVPYSSVKRLSPLLIISHLEVKIRKTFGSLVHFRGNMRRDILARLHQSMVLHSISFPVVTENFSIFYFISY